MIRKKEVKEILGVLLEGRAYVFSFFHRLLGAEPTKELLDAVSSEESLQVIALFIRWRRKMQQRITP